MSDPGRDFLDPEEDETEKQEAEQEMAFETSEEWLTQWALPHYRRRFNAGGHKWDPAWWQYEEAQTVIEALWRTFEQMRWEGATGLASFMRDYFYPLMGQLTGPDGAFWAYDPPATTAPPATWATAALEE